MIICNACKKDISDTNFSTHGQTHKYHSCNDKCASVVDSMIKAELEGKNYKVAWIPSKQQYLTKAGVEALGGHFVNDNLTYDEAGMVAASLSLNNNSSGDYIAVYS